MSQLQSGGTGAMKILIFRAYKLCTLKKNKQEEIDFLNDTFIANDCPVTVTL